MESQNNQETQPTPADAVLFDDKDVLPSPSDLKVRVLDASGREVQVSMFSVRYGFGPDIPPHLDIVLATDVSLETINKLREALAEIAMLRCGVDGCGWAHSRDEMGEIAERAYFGNTRTEMNAEAGREGITSG